MAIYLEPSPTEEGSAPLALPPGFVRGEGPSGGPSTGSRLSGRQVLGLVIGGVGVAGVALGSVFGLMASSKWSSAKTDCGAGCGPNAPAQQEKSDAQSAATISTVGFVAGGALVAGGLALFLTAPAGSTSGTGPRVVPAVGAGGGGVLIRGTF